MALVSTDNDKYEVQEVIGQYLVSRVQLLLTMGKDEVLSVS